jgi:hypothetical protein
MSRMKIFGVGFHKTGTSSLHRAFVMLGYRSIHGDGKGSKHGGDEGVSLIRQIKAGDCGLATLPLYDAFTDNPYFTIWRQLAAAYPDAKFILTERDEDEWLNSCIRYYHGRRIRPMREWMFGEHADPSASEASARVWLAAYQDHNRSIRDHFSTNPERLLVMNLMKGDGWEKLCPFLGVPPPRAPFPHANQTKAMTLVGRVRRVIRRSFRDRR